MNFFKIIWALLFNTNFRRGNCIYFKAYFRSFKKDKRQRAIVDLESWLDKDCNISNHPMKKLRLMMLELLGICYHWNKQSELAEQTLRKALKVSTERKTKSAELYAYLGHICKGKGELEEALVFYDMAIEADKNKRLKNALADMELVRENKELLEKHKHQLPFASAYIKQQGRIKGV